ncbi:CBS domain-containing protein [Desulfosarcina ovata subsp. sediminis]|uniref:CBS domain-containing protein n=1 Tax=Desulfosarcina ovata subsp. sediminis TaxID=885957 RepID=A0A5K7ZZ48_9BACT|nr:CBS domain-containing protein [Desulfosarcina ovata]BBO85522.1 CBS domain-containing protein [Desulfosarcina ovata subsp. sediminis]
MFVSQSMVSEVITIDADASVFEAQEKMAANHIRHLPVVDAGRLLIGIVTDRDIRSAMPYRMIKNKGTADEREKLAQLKVADIMTSNPKTISPMYTLPDALLLIQKAKVGAFPVVDDDGRLMGILSVRDLLRAFINVLGIREPGTLLCIEVEEKVGQMKKIVDAITEENISLGSVLVARTWEAGKRAVFPYLLTNTVTRIKKKLVAMGYRLIDPMEWYLDQLPKSK